MSIEIDDLFIKLDVPVTLLIIDVSFQYNSFDPEIWYELLQCIEMRLKEMEKIAGSQPLIIQKINQQVKKCGFNPSRYPYSSLSLLKRIISSKNINSISNIVDLNNLLSLYTLCPVGVYDKDKIQGNIIFKVGSNELIDTIGKGLLNTKGVPIFKDSLGVFGSIVNDSKRTCISENTANVLLIIISFNSPEFLKDYEDNILKIIEKKLKPSKLKYYYEFN